MTDLPNESSAATVAVPAAGAVWVLVRRELLSALRDRSVLLSTVVLPLLLYPLLLWLIFAGIGFVRGQDERHHSRVAIFGPAADSAFVDEAISSDEPATDDGIDWVESDGADRQAMEERVVSAELDAALEILPAAEEGAALHQNFRVEMLWDSSTGRSVRARERVLRWLDAERVAWVDSEVRRLGIDPATWAGFHTERMNLASKEEMGAFILGLMAPLFTVLMVAVGCFYAAIDTTAGERERSTWETSLTLAVSRSRVVLAKYLAVAVLGWVAGSLNLLALSFSMRVVVASAMGDATLRFTVPWTAWPLVALSTALLALFIAAGMMIFASFARTFKEGQAMVSPFYLLCILPALMVQAPDLELDGTWALVPIANVSLLFRDAIVGTYHWPWIGLTLLVEMMTIALCLALARRLMADEEVMTGVFQGGFVGFVRRRILHQVPTTKERA